MPNIKDSSAPSATPLIEAVSKVQCIIEIY